MLGTFFDTIIICSLTALVIIISGSWMSGENGVALTSNAFVFGLPNIGDSIVTICLILFLLQQSLDGAIMERGVLNISSDKNNNAL